MTADKCKYVRYAVSEKHEVITNDYGLEMKLKNIFTQDICIRWGEYQNPEQATIQFKSNNEGVVSHFQIHGHEMDLPEKSFVLYKDPGYPHEIELNATSGYKRTFFELIVSPSFFSNFQDDQNPFFRRFEQHNQYHGINLAFTAQATPAMFRTITEMRDTPYTGNMNRLFIESKATELLLLQIAHFDSQTLKAVELSSSHIERLTFIKEHIDQHFARDLSISALARYAGINQTKLKSGFRQLFHHTIFAYITELRLAEAKRLLSEEKLYVSEAAYRVGYKYPHHFAALFKKKFGMSPAYLKSV